MGFVSCAGCGKPEPAEDLVEAIVSELSPAGEPISEAVIERCAAEVEARLDADRVAHFAPMRHDAAFSRVVADHEAAHAVVGLWFGAVVESVNIDTTVSCRFATRDGLPPLQRAMIDLAGHAAAQAGQRIRTRSPADVSFCAWAARASTPKTCDSCKAMRAIAGTMPDAGDAAWLGAFFAIEDRTISLVRRLPVLEAIIRISDALVERGHLSGDEVVALAGPEITGARP